MQRIFVLLSQASSMAACVFSIEKDDSSIRESFHFLISDTGPINCFDCNSWEDSRCHDPFNYTIFPEDMPKTKKCKGCCVKMVQFIGTGEALHTVYYLKVPRDTFVQYDLKGLYSKHKYVILPFAYTCQNPITSLLRSESKSRIFSLLHFRTLPSETYVYG